MQKEILIVLCMRAIREAHNDRNSRLQCRVLFLCVFLPVKLHLYYNFLLHLGGSTVILIGFEYALFLYSPG